MPELPLLNPVEVLSKVLPKDYLGEDTSFTFKLCGYSYSVEWSNNGGGRSSLSGVFHPDSVCEGKGICIYCGRTLQFIYPD